MVGYIEVGMVVVLVEVFQVERVDLVQVFEVKMRVPAGMMEELLKLSYSKLLYSKLVRLTVLSKLVRLTLLKLARLTLSKLARLTRRNWRD